LNSSDPPPIRFRDRLTGAIETERIYQGDRLRLLYGRARLLTDLVLTRRWFSQVYGWLQRSPRSRPEIARFISSLGVNVDEVELPPEAYGSLDAFFTRRLKPGARPIDPDPARLVSPCDARLLVARLDRSGGELSVKRSRVTVDELVGDAALAAAYRGGTAYIFRLAPVDYHRFHFSDGGNVEAARPVSGPLHSVHPIALAAGAPSFRNQRAWSILQSDHFGSILIIEIGALTIGTIVQTYEPGRVERGAEKGYFGFGGSTVVLLLEPNRVILDEDLVAHSALERAEPIETLVKMGTAIGRVCKAGVAPIKPDTRAG
jgi:phosphatidylserine decarboxylase